MGGMDNSPTASHHCPLNSSHQANRMPGQFTIGQFTLDKQNAWSVHHWTVHTGQTGCLVNSPLNSSHRANRTPGQFTTRQFTTRQFTLGKQNAWSIHHHTVHHQAVHTRQTECLVNSPPDRSPPSSSHWANRTPGQFTTRQFTPGKQNAWSIHWTVHTRQTEPLVNSPPDSSHWANRTPGQFTTGQFFYLYHQESSTLFGRGAGIAQWLEHRTRDWKVAGSNPCWNGGRIFFSRVDFLCWLLFRYPFHPRVTTVARKKSRSFCQKVQVAGYS